MAATTLSERDVENLIFLFAMGALPRQYARTLKLSVPTCYRFYENMLARLYDVGWIVDDEGAKKMMADDPGIIARFAAWKERAMRQHRGFESEFKREVENMKYNALYMNMQVYERTYAAELASKSKPTEEDRRLAKLKIIKMVANDLIRIVLHTGPLNREPGMEQLAKAYEKFTQSFERKVIKFKRQSKKKVTS